MSIAAVLVDHDTSAWAELAIRSLFEQNPGLDLSLTVYDNDSRDDRTGMLAACERYGVPVVASGFTTSTLGNSHGEVLGRFALDPAHAGADHLLFLDADVCFTRPGTIAVLVDVLDAEPEAFGAGPRMSWDGETAMPAELAENPKIYRDRLHPCCALVRNTPVFRSVVEHVGLSAARRVHADGDEFLDTFELMTQTMLTHGMRHVIADDAVIMHAFAVSYPDASAPLLPGKIARRDHLLELMRSRG